MGDKSNKPCGKSINRRHFMFSSAAAGGAIAFGLNPFGLKAQDGPEMLAQMEHPELVKTNIAKAMAIPKTDISMPGPFPGIVSKVHHEGSLEGRTPQYDAVKAMLAAGMKSLTGVEDSRDAWAGMFSPEDRIGIKPNSVGGRIIGTTHELTKAVIAALEEIGVPRKNMVIWEHYDIGLKSAGFIEENYPGIGFDYIHYLEEVDGKQVAKGMDKLDMDVYYEADYYLPPEKNAMNYMLHADTKSYYPKFLTGGVDKIINLPSHKDHSASYVTLALKNLSYGAMSNCIRGHDFIDRYVAETCAFPPIRDKTVLNILDGLRAQYAGGPSPNSKYIWTPKDMYFATDPVAMDSVGFDVILDKQVKEGILLAEKREAKKEQYNFLAIAENLGLGVYKSKPIEVREVELA